MKQLTGFVFVLHALASIVAADELKLAADGKSDYVIVVAANPTAGQSTAARELQQHLTEVTGVTLPVVSETDAPEAAPQIVVGQSNRLKQLLPDLNIDAIGDDGIVLKSVGRDLVLAGPEPRGTLYAVFTFLEDVVGVRWWSSTERFVPTKPTLTVPELNIQYAPKLRYREAFYFDATNGIHSARLKCNGQFNHVPAEYGGHHRFAGFVHTFYPLLPPEKYFAAHPEWYSEIGGKRTVERAQLCLTNEEMRRELVRNAIETLRREPNTGFISISQNDWHGHCECAQCKAVEAEEGAPSGVLLRFVNAVAEEIEREFPKVLVETLAYQHTRKPPKHVRPRDNVVVRLCSIECCFVEPIEGPRNAPFHKDVVAWSRIAPRLFIWDYVTNFSNYLVPHPNHRVLAPNVRFLVNHNAVGLFEQGDIGSPIGDFVRLRAWLLAHLMWDPARDEKALIREFLEGYYGAAAPHLAEYLKVIDDAGERSPKPLGCYIEDTNGWLTLDDLNKATSHFDNALAAVAGDSVLSARVRRERLTLDHAWLIRYSALKRAARRQQLPFPGPADPAAAAREFIQLAEQWNAGEHREGRPFAVYKDELLSRFRAAGSPPELCRDLPADEWIDLQDNEFRLEKRGTLSMIVEDPAASDGYAARMPGNHQEWAVSCPVSDDLAAEGNWRCYASVRFDATAKAGPAISMGLYDSRLAQNVAYRCLNAGESANSEYQMVELGTCRLHGDMYFWFAPPQRADEVDAVFIDRVFLVRDKSGT